MKTWRSSGTRFFATLIESFLSWENHEHFWFIWVTAACGKTSANNFRAEIRLSSNILPQCSLVYYMPVVHLDSDILRENADNLSKRTTCLHLHHKIIGKYMKRSASFRDFEGSAGLELKSGTDIPFKCLVHKKVFLSIDKTDIEEKEKTDERKTEQQ